MTNSDTSAYTETNKTTNIFPFSNFIKSKFFFFLKATVWIAVNGVLQERILGQLKIKLMLLFPNTA